MFTLLLLLFIFFGGACSFISPGALHTREVGVTSRMQPAEVPSRRAGSVKLRVSAKDVEVNQDEVILTKDLRRFLRSREESTWTGYYTGPKPFSYDTLSLELRERIGAAPEKVRIESYKRILAEGSRMKHQLDILEARVVKQASAVLCPTTKDQAAALGAPPRLSMVVMTQANAEAAELAAEWLLIDSPRYDETIRAAVGGWILFLIHFARSAPIEEPHIAIDEETVGMKFDMLSFEEKEEAKADREAKLYNKYAATLLPPDGYKTLNVLSEKKWPNYVTLLPRHIRDLFLEVRPSPENAIFWLRNRSKTCLGEMIRRAAKTLAVEAGSTVPAPPCAMNGIAQVRAIMELGCVLSCEISTLTDGDSVPLTKSSIREAALSLRGAAPEVKDFSNALYGVAVKDFVNTLLTEGPPKRQITLVGPSVIKGMLSVGDFTGVRVASREYGHALAAKLETIGSRDGGQVPTVPLKIIDDALELDEVQRKEPRIYALRAYMSKYLATGDSYVPDEVGQRVCKYLNVPESKMLDVLDEERSEAFAETLDKVLKVPGPGGKGSSYRYTPLTAEEVANLREAIRKTGVSPKAAHAGIARELKLVIQSLIAKGAQMMKAKKTADGKAVISQIESVLDGLVQQLFDELDTLGNAGQTSEDDIVKTLSLKGTLTETEEFWMSELCWAVIDEGEEGEEEKANRVLDVMGIS